MSFTKKTKTLLSALALSTLAACQTAEKINTIEQPTVSEVSKDANKLKSPKNRVRLKKTLETKKNSESAPTH